MAKRAITKEQKNTNLNCVQLFWICCLSLLLSLAKSFFIHSRMTWRCFFSSCVVAILPSSCLKRASASASLSLSMSSVLSGDRPTLPELLCLNVHKKVGANYYTFGILLLNDATGSRVDSIKVECLGTPDTIIIKILQEWLQVNGLLPVTWNTLIETLRNTEWDYGMCV